jgi:hypothetical protein
MPDEVTRSSLGTAPTTDHGARGLDRSARARTLPTDEVASLEERLERLERDRAFLLTHSRNLERQLYRLTRRRDRHDPGPAAALALHARELEARLTEVTRAHAAVVNSRTWRALAPYRALLRWVQLPFRR